MQPVLTIRGAGFIGSHVTAARPAALGRRRDIPPNRTDAKPELSAREVMGVGSVS